MALHQVQIRRLTSADLPFADTLRAAAGWNQTLADWRRLLRYAPAGCFFAEFDGTPAGTVTTTAYGNEVGWIGMVLVHPEQRRRGVATALLAHAIDYLQGCVRCIKLDATPAGEQVYTQLGFQPELTLTRWHCSDLAKRGLKSSTELGRLSRVQRADWPRIDRFDTPIFGTSRRQWLELLAGDSLETLIAKDSTGGACAYGMVRAGMLAHYVGPVVSSSEASGTAMLLKLLTIAASGPVFWDIPDDCVAAVALARELGFTPQRHLQRMFLGPSQVTAQPACQWAIAGFATG